ncbi:hypothetical protein Gura_1747 [Geotalea uraniireducens Rf4]|uniref:Uncharacterized protein n=1 Tax=Geotalea uraniireducens (strain Rf4) TaxID=351605 RepID=A5GET5_GEOUR|nr:hypothetical protein Gura_1747 [Geotalea uraniireducens Rf4]
MLILFDTLVGAGVQRWGSDDLIRNWLRNRNTIEFFGIWEQLNNIDFNPVEFHGIKMQAGRGYTS